MKDNFGGDCDFNSLDTFFFSYLYGSYDVGPGSFFSRWQTSSRKERLGDILRGFVRYLEVASPFSYLERRTSKYLCSRWYPSTPFVGNRAATV